MLKQPYREVPFDRGPSLVPVDALLEWLEHQTNTVRLPFEVLLAEPPTSVASAELGVGGATGLSVEVSDAALGISLADRVRTACPKERRCAVWLEGRWSRSESGYHFDVLRFVRAIPPEEIASASYAEVMRTAE